MYIIMCNYVTYQSMATRKYHYVLVRQSHPVKDISKMWSTLSPTPWARNRKINIVSNFIGSIHLFAVDQQNSSAQQISNCEVVALVSFAKS